MVIEFKTGLKIGDLVRYDTDGSSALMILTSIGRNGQYYGEHVLSCGLQGSSYILRPTEVDYDYWERLKKENVGRGV